MAGAKKTKRVAKKAAKQPRTTLGKLPGGAALAKLTPAQMEHLRSLPPNPIPGKTGAQWKVIAIWCLPEGPDDIFRYDHVAVR